ncbi:MAG TPA: nucleotidyltransferase domain-containing protein [Candidatus Coprenecus merdigallinarum]|nr:nucleotidyltransferase domain-containing protein [Candidatus Coprenecus merdigallinarum]
MRLSKREIEVILQVAEDIYGTDVKVYLFGSRVDDSRRGGDIDLLVRTTSAKKGILERVRMASRIKSLIGDQKIDIIGDYEDNQVVREALKNGILLAI